MHKELSYAYILLAPTVLYVVLKLLFFYTDIQTFEDLLIMNSTIAIAQIVALPKYIDTNKPLKPLQIGVVLLSVIAFGYSAVLWLGLMFALGSL